MGSTYRRQAKVSGRRRTGHNGQQIQDTRNGKRKKQEASDMGQEAVNRRTEDTRQETGKKRKTRDKRRENKNVKYRGGVAPQGL